MQSLFYKFDAHSAIEHQKKQLIEELRYLSEAQLKGTSTEKWEAYFFDKHNINTPTLLQDKIEIDFRDTKIDARNLPDRMFYRESDRPILVDGFTITLTIPFEGDEAIFQCSGNRIYHNTVKAHIKSDHLVLNYNYATHDPDKINADTKRDVNFIDGFLNEMRSGFDSYNNSINGIVKQHLSERIEKFKKDEELKSKLAFPLKPRPNSSQTYTSPVVKKCIRVERPVASKDIITPEPVISDDDYNNILKICHSMTLVMEKRGLRF